MKFRVYIISTRLNDHRIINFLQGHQAYNCMYNAELPVGQDSEISLLIKVRNGFCESAEA